MWFHNIFRDKKNPVKRSATHSVGSNRANFIGLNAQTIRLLDRLKLNLSPRLAGTPAGYRSSQMRRSSSEFREHRSYVPGDDVRYIDWKASARQEHVFIKQGEEQKGAMVYLLIDCSASMAWGTPPKSIAALSLANALGYLALAQSDRLVVVPVTPNDRQTRPHPLGPLWGKSFALKLNLYLRAIRLGGRIDLNQALIGLSRGEKSRGGLVLVISDLLGISDISQGLEALSPPAWDLVLCHVLHPAELNPIFDGPLEMQDVETGQKKLCTITSKDLETYRQRLEIWQNEIAEACQLNNRAVYCMLPTNWHLETEILPQLRRARVVTAQ